MDRINGSNVAPDLHGAGKDGWRDGNKALGIPATVVTAEFLNSIQEEVASVIESQGIVLNVGDKTQLKQAIERMVKGGDYKQSVRAASTVNVAAISGLLTVDGVNLVAGDRVLLKNQTTATQNGIYIAAAGVWTRSDDADAGAEFNGGAIIPVEEGATNADTNWQITNNGTVTIGTTALTFAVFGTNADASTIVKGILKLATDILTKEGIDTSTAVTPASLSSRTATEEQTGLVEKATAIEAQTFTADKFLDGALLNLALKGANQSLVANGYQKLLGGMIIQWGFHAGAGNTTFPIAFPNACFVALTCYAGTSGGVTTNARALTTTGFNNTLVTGDYYWIAGGC